MEEAPTLRVRLEKRSAGRHRVTLEVPHRDPGRRWSASWPARLFGVPGEGTPAGELPDDGFTVPGEVLRAVGGALEAGGSDGTPRLWLDVRQPRGHLHLLPWERLLSTSLARTVLRTPYLTPRPPTPGDRPRVVLCAGGPVFAPDLADLAEQWHDGTGHRASVHVFTGRDCAGRVRGLVAGRPGVVVHDPPVALAPRPGDPWLNWIGAALAGRPVDVVHFVGAGRLAGDRGELVFPGSPAGDGVTRAVDGARLARFVGDVGAWFLALTSPPSAGSPTGLVGLADAVARTRPATVLVHDLGLDRTGELPGILKMIFRGDAPDGPTPAVTCWARPADREVAARSARTGDGHSAPIHSAARRGA
ncbi:MULTISPECIES: hypothetical protein [unclassified Streptosporangium]|uniref:hypothetical protein n=1 Tax=unclassified Streptosporangium TaxID=2632669 RepID=UPI002E29C3EE|nr:MULTISPECIES: hypothetical protein [unclassified Streptosporangium]